MKTYTILTWNDRDVCVSFVRCHHSETAVRKAMKQQAERLKTAGLPADHDDPRWQVIEGRANVEIKQ